jgi:hypothetical protein
LVSVFVLGGCAESDRLHRRDASSADGPATTDTAEEGDDGGTGDVDGGSGDADGGSGDANAADAYAVGSDAAPTYDTDEATLRGRPNGPYSFEPPVDRPVSVLVGDTLYALSHDAGLAVVSVSNPDKPVLLGNYRELRGVPFDAFVRDGQLIALFTDWKAYVETGGVYSYKALNMLVVLDVRDPKSIQVLGTHTLPGPLSAARLRGDVLYCVVYEGLSSESPAKNTLLALDLQDPRNVRRVDQTSFWVGNSDRSAVVLSGERAYGLVDGPAASGTGREVLITAIDLSDASGRLVRAGSATVPGTFLASGVNEREGVVRVIAQQQDTLQLATFAVGATSQLTPVGSGEYPWDAHAEPTFQGTGAYFLKGSTLVTIDFADPAQPAGHTVEDPAGELRGVTPGGGRLVGYRSGAVDGVIEIGAFDISNMSAPRVLSPITLGHAWGTPAVPHFVAETDLFMVQVNESDLNPFILPPECCAGKFASFFYLLDVAGTALSSRGKVAAESPVSRAFLHRDHVWATAAHSLAAIEVGNSGAPEAAGAVAWQAPNDPTGQALVLPSGVIARLNGELLELLTPGAAGAQEVLGRLPLGTEMVRDATPPPFPTVSSLSFAPLESRLFAQASGLQVVYRRKSSAYKWPGEDVAGVLSVDVRDASKPVLLGKLEWKLREAGNFEPGFEAVASAAMPGAARLLVLETHTGGSRLRSVDVSTASAPTTQVVELGDGDYTGLSATDQDVFLTFHRQGPAAQRVRFFLRAVSVEGKTGHTVLGEPISVPGTVVYRDGRAGRAVVSALTLADELAYSDREGQQQCDRRFGFSEHPDIRAQSGTCRGYKQALHLVKLSGAGATIEDSLVIEPERVITSMSAGDDRIFAVLSGSYSDIFYDDPQPIELLTVAGIASGRFESGRLQATGGGKLAAGFWDAEPVLKEGDAPFQRSPSVYAFGQLGVLATKGAVSVIDARAAQQPRIIRSESVEGVTDVVFRESRAVLTCTDGSTKSISLP